MIARWKGIIEEIHFGGSIMPSDIIETSISKKPHLGPQNGPGSENLLKIVNCQNGQKTVLSHLEKVGGPRYPPGSPLSGQSMYMFFHLHPQHLIGGLSLFPKDFVILDPL